MGKIKKTICDSCGTELYTHELPVKKYIFEKDFDVNNLFILLNIIEKQQKEIEELKAKHYYINGLRNGKTLMVQNLERAREFEILTKMVNEMTEYLASIDFDEHCVEVPGICICCPKEDDLDGYMRCIKQYFGRKVENG